MVARKKEIKEKSLEKMTAKELREVAKEIPEISGVYGMNKIELISAVKKARGMEEGPARESDASVREIKKKIKKVRSAREIAVEANDRKMLAVYRRRISRLKKKTRRSS